MPTAAPFNCVCYPLKLRAVSRLPSQCHLCRAIHLRSLSVRSWTLSRAGDVATALVQPLCRLSGAKPCQPAPQQHRVLHSGKDAERAVHHQTRTAAVWAYDANNDASQCRPYV